SQPSLQPASPLPAPSPYTEKIGGLTERREPKSRPALSVCAVRSGRHFPRPRPPPVLSTHAMALRPSSVPLHVPLPAPLESSLPAVPDPKSDLARAASPTVSRLCATGVTDPSFESTAASALVAELVDFAAACRLDYAIALVAESESAGPSSVGGECAVGTDVLEDTKEDFECLATAVPRFASMLLAPEGDPDAPDIPTPRSYAEEIMGPYSSHWQVAMDAEMPSLKSTGTYVDEVPPSGANIFDGMWIFRVKRPSGSPPAFKARYVARGFSQQQGVDYFHTFSLTPKMTTLRVLLHVTAQRDYELHSLDFSTAFLQGSLHEEIWLRRPPGFTWSFLAGLHLRLWGLLLRLLTRRCFYAPTRRCRRSTSTADTEALTLVKSDLQKRHTCTDLEPSGPYPEFVGCLMYLMTCTLPDLAYPLSLLAHYVAPGRHRKPRHPTVPHGSYSCSYSYCTATTATAAIMATPSVLTFDAEGRPIKFEVWLDDLHLFLQITAKDDVSLYNHTSGAAPAPPATADSTARSQWQTRDAHARLAVRSHLPLDEREHFGQHKTAKELYDAVVARYSSPAIAAIGRLSLPYLFPDLSAFATVADLITHLRTSDLRYRAALPPDFLAKNPPLMYLVKLICYSLCRL
ncbi:unnamed protein product, partial [Closterium sp. NIES-53]